MTNHNIIAFKEISEALSKNLQCLVDAILEKYGNTIYCILFYGSCLRTGNIYDGVIDFYVIVKDYRVYKNKLLSLLNVLLPPNVFYIEVTDNQGRTLRAKYGVFSIKHLKKMTDTTSHNPYLWARLIQPVAMLYAKNKEIKEQIRQCIKNSAITFLTNVIPCLPSELDIKTFWDKAFLLTYKSELRPESKNTVKNIYKLNEVYFDNILLSAIQYLPYKINVKKIEDNYLLEVAVSKKTKIFYKIIWIFNIIKGNIFTMLRLIKSLFTFNNALTYGYYKLSKHTPNVAIPKIFRKSLFFSCWYIFLTGIKRKLFK